MYFAISPEIVSNIKNKYNSTIVEKFEAAICNGFVGKYGKSGIKNIDEKII